MTTHYLDFFIRTEINDRGMMMGRLYGVVHGILASHDWNHVGVAFPSLRMEDFKKSKNSEDPDASKKLNWLRQFRLFSDKDTLEIVRENSGITFLEKIGGIEAKIVEPVPANVPHVIYQRNRKPEKRQAGHHARADRRLLRRLEQRFGRVDLSDVEQLEQQYNRSGLCERVKQLLAQADSTETSSSSAKQELLPFIQLRSSSTHRGFSLFLSVTPAPTPVEGKFTAYGLASNGQPSVPSF